MNGFSEISGVIPSSTAVGLSEANGESLSVINGLITEEMGLLVAVGLGGRGSWVSCGTGHSGGGPSRSKGEGILPSIDPVLSDRENDWSTLVGVGWVLGGGDEGGVGTGKVWRTGGVGRRAWAEGGING
jgi:hypothetical protein